MQGGDVPLEGITVIPSTDKGRLDVLIYTALLSEEVLISFDDRSIREVAG